MATVVYILCGIASLLCSLVLLRAYIKTSNRLLGWSSASFGAMTVNNLLLFVDLVIIPHEISLAVYRLTAALIGALLLLFGLIWETT